MFDLNSLMDMPVYSFNQHEKQEIYLQALTDLMKHHYKNCHQYQKIIDGLNFNIDQINDIEDLPFLPVRLFKMYDLLSVDKSQIVKTMTSSGTTGQSVSKIFLDKITSTMQTKVLTKIVSSFTGKKRLPMLVIDTSSVLKDRNLFSARGAGILGFSMLGFDVNYVFDEKMEMDFTKIKNFLEKHESEPILLFGFTFMIWQHFIEVLKEKKLKLPINNGILIHGGGWKKLVDQAVDNNTFKQTLHDLCGINKVYNYYGMVEQTGSIFMECEAGYLHTSIFSDILIRDHQNFQCLSYGQQGLIQLISLLPYSYPGHVLLSEDLGEIIGEDDCTCGRKGKYFRILGRIKNAEIRGCSDTYDIK